MRIHLRSDNVQTGQEEWADLHAYQVKYTVKTREEAVAFLREVYPNAAVEDTGDVVFVRVPGQFTDQFRILD